MSALGVAPRFGQVEDFLAEDAPRIGEEQQVIVGAADEQIGVGVFVAQFAVVAAAPAAPLRAVRLECGALDVPALGDIDDHILDGDEVFFADVVRQIRDDRAALVAELVAQRFDLFSDLIPQLDLIAQNRLEKADLLEQASVLLVQILPRETRQRREAHIENRLRLRLAERESRHQSVSSVAGLLRSANDADDLVDVIKGDQQPLENMRPSLGFLDLVLGALGHDLFAMLEVIDHRVFQR